MRSKGSFRFKQFSVSHERSTHKIGTDGVLLGAWVNVEGAKHILDVGTGSGVIALMMAQRTPADVSIDAVEIEKEDYGQAIENVKQSPWPDKVRVHHTAIQTFPAACRYDLIVSNPPFFINSFRPPDQKRSQARHTHALSFDELLQSTVRLLHPQGTFAVILPYQEAIQFRERALVYGLYGGRELAFRSRPQKPIERLLTEYSFEQKTMAHETLVLHGEGESWSEDYKRLTGNFYLDR